MAIGKAPQQKLPYDPSSMTVFIIDDQDPIRKAIKRVLTTMGFKNIHEFFDGSDVLKTMAKKEIPIDLVITDLYMRKVSGFQVLKKIRAKTFGADVPIVVVTGEGSKDDIVKASDLGADEYVLKPFQISEIERKVTSVLTKYHSPPPLLKLLRQGERTMLTGDPQDALKLFEAALRLDPTSARAQLCKAFALDKLGCPQDALTILAASAKANTAYYKNYAAMADIYTKMGKKNETIEAMRNELSLNPKQPGRQCKLAELLIEDRKYDVAMEHYREALKENPKHKEALLGMGKAFDASDNQEKALYYYKRARRQHPDMPQALELIIRSFESRKEPRKAISTLMDDIHQFPTRVDARIAVAQLYAKFEEFDPAFKVLDDGLLRDPLNISLMKTKARILLTANKPADAITIYQKVIALEPTGQHYSLLGIAYMHDKQYPLAVQSLQTSLKDAQDRQRILTLLAEVHRRGGNILQAALTLTLAKESGDGNISAAALAADIRTLMQAAQERRHGTRTTPKAS